MTRQELAEVVFYISAAIGKELSAEALEVYYDLLGDLPKEVLQLAAKRVCLEHRWASFPTVAELRDAAAETQQGRVAALSPGEAWRIAWGIAGATDPEVDGSYQRALEAAKCPPLVREAIECFGLPALCYGTEPIGVVRGQFIKIYEGLAVRDKRSALLPAPVKQAIEAKRPAQVMRALQGIGTSIN